MPCYDKAGCGIMPDMHARLGGVCAFSMGEGACDTLDDLMALSDELFAPAATAALKANVHAAAAAPAPVVSGEDSKEEEAEEEEETEKAAEENDAAVVAPAAEDTDATATTIAAVTAAALLIAAAPDDVDLLTAAGYVDDATLPVTKGKRKTRICRLWLERRCRRRRCPFAHGRAELRVAADDDVEDAEEMQQEDEAPASPRVMADAPREPQAGREKDEEEEGGDSNGGAPAGAGEEGGAAAEVDADAAVAATAPPAGKRRVRRKRKRGSATCGVEADDAEAVEGEEGEVKPEVVIDDASASLGSSLGTTASSLPPPAGPWADILEGEGYATREMCDAELLGAFLRPDAAQRRLRGTIRQLIQDLVMLVDRACIAKLAGSSATEIDTFDSILDVVVEGGSTPRGRCVDAFADVLMSKQVPARVFTDRAEVMFFSHGLGALHRSFVQSSFAVRVRFCATHTHVMSDARREATAVQAVLRGTQLHTLVPAVVGVVRSHLPTALFAAEVRDAVDGHAHSHGDDGAGVALPPAMCRCALGWCPCQAPGDAPAPPVRRSHDPYAAAPPVEPPATPEHVHNPHVHAHDDALHAPSTAACAHEATSSVLTELLELNAMERAVTVLFVAYVQHIRTHPNFDDAAWLFSSFFEFYAGFNFAKNMVRVHAMPFPMRASAAAEPLVRVGYVHISDLVSARNLTPNVPTATLTKFFKTIAAGLRDVVGEGLSVTIPMSLLDRRNTVLFKRPSEPVRAKHSQLAGALRALSECLEEAEVGVHVAAIRAAIAGAPLDAAEAITGEHADVLHQAARLGRAMTGGLL